MVSSGENTISKPPLREAKHPGEKASMASVPVKKRYKDTEKRKKCIYNLPPL